MQRWWERWPERLEEEIEAFRKAGLTFHRDDKAWSDGRCVLVGDAPIAVGETTRIVVVYPDTFPYTRFGIFAPDLHLARHQATFTGNLCVFPEDGRYWRPEYLAADEVVKQVPEIVRLVRGSPEALRQVEVPQGEPATAFYPFWLGAGVVVPDSQLTALPQDRSIEGTFSLLMDREEWIQSVLDHGNALKALPGKALLTEVRDKSGRLAFAPKELLAGFRGPSWSGRWKRLANPIRGLDADSTIRQIDALFRGQKYIHNFRGATLELAAVVFPEEVRQGVLEDAWIFTLRVTRGGRHNPLLLRSLRSGRSDYQARIPELHSMPSKKVAVVGLGSLGAPFVTELARAQLGFLRVADFDFVDPAAGVRWISGLEYAGMLKTRAMQDWIARNYPFTVVEPFHLRIGDISTEIAPEQREAAQLEKMLDGANLLVDATAEENVTHALSAISTALGIPQLLFWGVDGLGGVVARLRPGTTGCYHCLRLLLSDGTIEPPPAADAERPRVQPRGCADPTFTATAPDLSPLSSQAARVAFSTLCGGAGGYSSIEYDVFVLALRTRDGDLLPVPQWRAYTLPKHPKCPLCSHSNDPA